MDSVEMSVNGYCRPIEQISETTTIDHIVRERVEFSKGEDLDHSFAIFDIGEVIKKFKTWIKCFPRVQPFYATKCNNDYQVLRALSLCGASFDCASKAEIKQVLDLGVQADRIIYGNPCKHPSMLRFAAAEGVSLMTFDNEAELYKINKIYPGARCVLRILPSKRFKVTVDLGDKFGCPVQQVDKLLKVARKLNLNVMGISFHVGSGCQDAQAYASAIKEARAAFDLGLQIGFNMQLLDIGGGFPGEDSERITFSEVADIVNKALDQYFPASDEVSIIAEPGRYFVTSAVTVAASIIGKRVMYTENAGHDENGHTEGMASLPEPFITYYISEGLYGWLNIIHYENPDIAVHTLKDDDEDEAEETYDSTIWGPTCDSIDCIAKRTKLPDLQLGDWVYFKSVGAYTVTTSCSFNSMPEPRKYYYCQRNLLHNVFKHSPDLAALD